MEGITKMVKYVGDFYVFRRTKEYVKGSIPDKTKRLIDYLKNFIESHYNET